jgi:hypothetical protein
VDRPLSAALTDPRPSPVRRAVSRTPRCRRIGIASSRNVSSSLRPYRLSGWSVSSMSPACRSSSRFDSLPMHWMIVGETDRRCSSPIVRRLHGSPSGPVLFGSGWVA